MWGETEETSHAAKNSSVTKTTSASNELKIDEPMEVDLEPSQQASVTPEKLVTVSVPPEATVISASVSPSKVFY